MKSNVFFPYVVGIRIMYIHISRDMYLRLGLHVQIRLYYVLPCKAKISAQHGIGFFIGSMYCVLRTNHAKFAKETSANFRNINIKKCTPFFGTKYILKLARAKCIHGGQCMRRGQNTFIRWDWVSPKKILKSLSHLRASGDIFSIFITFISFLF